MSLSEVGTLYGAIGWTYVAAASFAIVYLGEHYVADVIVGLLVAEPCAALSRSQRRSSAQLPERSSRRAPAHQAKRSSTARIGSRAIGPKRTVMRRRAPE